MGMQHFAELQLSFNNEESDYTETIETAFIGSRKKTVGSFNGEIRRLGGGRYDISYTDFPYYEGDEIEGYCKKLATALPNCSFSLEGQIHNEGSGGDYGDEVWAAFSNGILEYKFFSGFEKRVNRKRPDISKQTAIVRSSAGEGEEQELPLIEFPVGKVKKSTRKMLDRKPKKSDSPNRFEITIDHGPEYYEGIRLFYYDKAFPDYSACRERLLNAADELVQLFREETAEHDRESELRQGLIRKSYTLHVFRSFVWTIVEYCKNDEIAIREFSLDHTLALAQFVFDRGGANWECPNNSKRIGAVLLQENELFPTCAEGSLYKLIKALLTFEPIMRRAFDYLSQKETSLSAADKSLREALAAWCASALACFYGEVLGQGECEQVPTQRRSLPELPDELTVLGDFYYVTNDGACIACTDPSDTLEFPEGIKSIQIPNSFFPFSGAKEYYTQAKKIVFPASCIATSTGDPLAVEEMVIKASIDEAHFEIGSLIGRIHMCLKKIVFTGTIHSLELQVPLSVQEIILPKGLKRIEGSSLNNRTNLNSIIIPSSVEYIDESAFWTLDHVTELVVEKNTIAEKTVASFIEGRDDVMCKIIMPNE